MKIAIVGGGITGLSAAYYLQKWTSNTDIHLFDASERLGGVIGTLRQGSWMIERGADNFATLIPDALQLSRDLGIEGDLIRPNQEHRYAMVVCNGRLHRIPQGFSLMQPTRIDAIMASRVLSWPAKLRVAYEYFVSKRKDSSDESLQDFAIRRLGREAFERLVEPIVGGIFTARADELSMQAAMPEFAKMEQEHGGLIRAFLAKQKATRSKESNNKNASNSKEASGARYDQFMAPKQGMQWWLSEIERRLDRVSIHRNQSVDQIVRVGDRYQLIANGATNSDRSFDGVIVAAPAPKAWKLFRESLPEVAQDLKAIHYASSAVVVMIVDKKEIATDAFSFGIVVPQREKRDVLAISMSSEKYPGRVGDDEVLLRVFLGGAVRPDLFSKTDEELSSLAWDEIRDLLGVQTPPKFQSVVRWEESMPQYRVGHLQLVAKIRESLKKWPALKLAGNAYEGVGIPQCIRSAKGAIRELTEALGIQGNQA